MNSYGLQVRTLKSYGICSETKESYQIKFNVLNLLGD